MKYYFGKTLLPEIKEIRETVFLKEQGFPYEYDEYDEIAYHACIYDKNVAVAAARAYLSDEKTKTFHFGRIAVKKECRKQGYGKKIISLLEKNVATLGAENITIDAQLHAVPFYEKTGYKSQGEIFEEEGAPHLRMVKTL